MAVAERLLNIQPLDDTRTDRALVREAQLGSDEAAGVLIQRYYPRIRGFVSHFTYNRGNAEDLTQEVFARALKALGRFDGEYQFEHWLLRIAKNLCIDEARRNLHLAEPTDPDDLPELEGIPAPDYVWESVSQELVASVVRRALAALPPRQRAILVMREMEGMSYADIAAVIGTQPRGVEGTLRRARERFRHEVTMAERAEEGQATCRRVLRLVSSNPQAGRTEEATAHLARCSACRRATREGSAQPLQRVRAFGLVPLFGPLLRGAHWVRFRTASASSAVGPAVKRSSGRIRDAAFLAGLGTTAALAAPFQRMAEMGTGVVVATAVTFTPALAPALASAPPATTVVAAPAVAQVSSALPVQVMSLTPASVLYKPSGTGPLTASVPQPVAAVLSPPTPSLVVAPPAPSTAPNLLGQLTELLSGSSAAGQGAATSNSATAAVNGTVASVGSILASQVNQVAQMVSGTVSEVTNSLPTPLQQVTKPVSTITNGLLNGISSGALGATGHH